MQESDGRCILWTRFAVEHLPVALLHTGRSTFEILESNLLWYADAIATTYWLRQLRLRDTAKRFNKGVIVFLS
jgi:hypothetical protein